MTVKSFICVIFTLLPCLLWMFELGLSVAETPKKIGRSVRMVGLGEQFPSRPWMFPPVERTILIYLSFNNLSENYKPFSFLVWQIVRSTVLSTVQMKTVTGKYGSWEAGLELGVSVSLAGECFFFFVPDAKVYIICVLITVSLSLKAIMFP